MSDTDPIQQCGGGVDPAYPDDFIFLEDDASPFNGHEYALVLASLKHRWVQRYKRNVLPFYHEFISTPRSKGWLHELWEHEGETSERGENT